MNFHMNKEKKPVQQVQMHILRRLIKQIGRQGSTIRFCHTLVFVADYCMQLSALFQNIFQFCTFLHKFSNILPFFCPFKFFLPFFALFLENYMHVLTFQNRPCFNLFVYPWKRQILYCLHCSKETIFLNFSYKLFNKYFPLTQSTCQFRVSVRK